MFDEIIIERQWEVNGYIITKSYLKDELEGKRIANSIVYSVDEPDGDNIDCFKTLAEAKKCARRM